MGLARVAPYRHAVGLGDDGGNTAHAAAFVAIASMPARLRVERQPEGIVALEEDVVAHADESQSEPQAPEAVAAPPRAGIAGAIGRVVPRGGGAGEPSDTPAPSAPSPHVTTGDAWTFNVAPNATSIDATSRKLVGVVPTPREAPPKAPPAATGSKTGGVSEALDEHDRALGISRGGEVLSAMEAVARSGSSPLRGNATFVVVVMADGAVSVSLENASEAHDDWARDVAAMQGAIAKRHVRLAPGARGVRIVVRLESRVQYADGRDPRANGARVTGQGFAVHETKQQITLQLPSVTASVTGKVCGAGITVGLAGVSLGGGCSPENGAAGEIRVVSGRVVGETRL